jgi:hypothetical protein
VTRRLAVTPAPERDHTGERGHRAQRQHRPPPPPGPHDGDRQRPHPLGRDARPLRRLGPQPILAVAQLDLGEQPAPAGGARRQVIEEAALLGRAEATVEVLGGAAVDGAG